MSSTLRQSIELLENLGLYDTVLPFLLTFTLVFAFLEKTKVLGTESRETEKGSTEITKKNLNSMTAFSISFIVVASSQIVGLLNEIVAGVGLVIVMVFLFLLTIGSFQEQKDKPFFLEGPWKVFFEIVVVLSITLIFLEAMGWLQEILNFVEDTFNSTANSETFALIILLLVMISFIIYVVAEPKDTAQENQKSTKD